MHPFNSESTLWPKLKEVRLALKGGDEIRAVVRAKAAAKYIIFVVEGCSSREEADALRGVEVSVTRDALTGLGKDEFYYADLAGLAVVDPEGTSLGEVVRVLEYPAVDCLEVRCEGGFREVPLAAPWLHDVEVELERVVVVEFDELPLRRS